MNKSNPSARETIPPRKNIFQVLIAVGRTILAMLFFIFFVISFLSISLITLRRWSIQISGPALRFWGRGSLWLLGIPFVIEGEWPFKEPKARVCICNHQSTLDLMWFCSVCPNYMGGIGKKELRRVPLFNLVWWALRLTYIDRSNRDSAIQTLQAVGRDIIEQKRSVTIAPEGTRSADGRISPFKKGAFHLALTQRLSIYPMIVAGAYEAMPKGALIAYPHPIHVRFLPPISTKDWSLDQLNQHIQSVQAIVEEGYHQLRADIGLEDLTSP